MANVKWKLGLYLTSISGYDDASRTATGGTGRSRRSNGRTYTHAKQFTQELRVAPTTVDRFSWVIGGHYFREKLFSSGAAPRCPLSLKPLATVRLTSTIFETEERELAGFATAAFKFTDWAKLSAGARWTVDKKEIDLGAANTAPAAGLNGTTSLLGGRANHCRARCKHPPAKSRAILGASLVVPFDCPRSTSRKKRPSTFTTDEAFAGSMYYGGVNGQSNVSTVKPQRRSMLTNWASRAACSGIDCASSRVFTTITTTSK